MSGRIPQYFIDDILTRVDIVDIINSRIKLKKTGRNYSACCPFHKEKTPSFSVSPDKQFYYCFGCGASGNALGFLMNYDHMDFPAAVDYLANQLGLDIPRESSGYSDRTRQNANLYTLTEQAADFFRDRLFNSSGSKTAFNYLKKRGLDQKTLQTFGVGYAPTGWENLKKHFSETPESEKKLLTTGLLVQHDENHRIYDRFRNRILFPIRDQRGRYIGFGGRVLDDSKPKYLNSPESPIFHKGSELYGLYEARKYQPLEQLIVVEGYMDVISMAQHGITHCVATLGTATTPEHVQRLFKLVDDVVYCFDGDNAGIKAAWRALESTLPYKKDNGQARFLFLPKGEDPDTFVKKAGSEAFLQRIQQQAISLDHFLFKKLEQGLNLDSLDGRSQLVTRIIPYIAKVSPDAILKQLLLTQLHQKSGLEPEYLINYLNNFLHQQEPATPVNSSHRQTENQATLTGRVPSEFQKNSPLVPSNEPPYQTHKSTGIQTSGHLPEITNRSPYQQEIHHKNDHSLPSTKMNPVFYAIRQLICDPALAQEVKGKETLLKKNNPYRSLLVTLIETLQHQPAMTIGTLIASWYGTEQGRLLESIALLELGDTPNRQEFLDTIERIKRNADEQHDYEQSNTLKNSLQNKRTSQLDNEERSHFREIFTRVQERHGIRKSPEKK
ncbi:DNA primase [invertebrate metagenome]|uniref:DNA primase n=1 Tax=invertebrate metagenome TaxID=1711999 RepID=A0A2H9T656_9ZZZZ